MGAIRGPTVRRPRGCGTTTTWGKDSNEHFSPHPSNPHRWLPTHAALPAQTSRERAHTYILLLTLADIELGCVGER